MLVTLSPSSWLKTIFSSKMVVSPARNSGSNTMAAAEADEADIKPLRLRRATRHLYYAF